MTLKDEIQRLEKEIEKNQNFIDMMCKKDSNNAYDVDVEISANKNVKLEAELKGILKGAKLQKTEDLKAINEKINWLKIQKAKPFIYNYDEEKVKISIKTLEELLKKLEGKK